MRCGSFPGACSACARAGEALRTRESTSPPSRRGSAVSQRAHVRCAQEEAAAPSSSRQGTPRSKRGSRPQSRSTQRKPAATRASTSDKPAPASEAPAVLEGAGVKGPDGEGVAEVKEVVGGQAEEIVVLRAAAGGPKSLSSWSLVCCRKRTALPRRTSNSACGGRLSEAAGKGVSWTRLLDDIWGEQGGALRSYLHHQPPPPLRERSGSHSEGQ